jgi:hypothetical protein
VIRPLRLDAEWDGEAVPNALTMGMDLSRADSRVGSLADTPPEELLTHLTRD